MLDSCATPKKARRPHAGAEQHGKCNKFPVYTPTQWSEDQLDRSHSVPDSASGRVVDFLDSFSVVVPACLRRGVFGADVLCDRGISPLFFAPVVQDQPVVSIRDCVHGYFFFAEGSVMVGGASPAPSPLQRSGRGSALADAVRIFLV